MVCFHDVKQLLGRNLRGEMTATFHESMSIMDHDLIEGVARTLSLSTRDEVNKLKDALFPSLFCAAAKAADVPALEKLINSVSESVCVCVCVFACVCVCDASIAQTDFMTV